IVPTEFQQILPANVKLIPLEDSLSLSEVLLVYRKDHDEIIQHCAEQIHQMFLS
ncbi:LysR family transcriptional regulator, partial [Acinetobacter baumannii]